MILMPRFDIVQVDDARRFVKRTLEIEFGLKELMASDSFAFGLVDATDTVIKYDPDKHAACDSPPVHAFFDGLDDGAVKNLDEIRGMVKRYEGSHYMMGAPQCFNAPDSGGDVMAAVFPVNLYKERVKGSSKK